MSRESLFTQELATLICSRMASGESLRAICRPDEFPAESTVRLWALQDIDGFSAQYARARELQADALAEEILEISDDSSNDYAETDDGPKLNSEHVQRSRLRVDSRKWFAGKVAPKKYGDKVQQEHSGPEGGPMEFRWATSDKESTPDPSNKS